MAALYRAMWYRLLLDEPLDTAYAAALTRLVSGSEDPRESPGQNP